MDESTEQSVPTVAAPDNGRVAVRIIVAVVVSLVSLVEFLVSAQTAILVLDIVVIVTAVAFAIDKSWARNVLAIIVVLATFGYVISAMNGGGQFAITNTVIWGAILLGVLYANGAPNPDHMGA